MLIGRSLVSINSNALMHDFAVEILFFPERFHHQLLQIFRKQCQPVLVGKDHHILVALAIAGVIPHERQKHCGILGHILCTRVLIHRRCAGEKIIDTKTLQGHRQKTDRAHHRSASTDPIVHREPGEPTVLFCVLVQIAAHAGYSHCVLVKLQPLFFESHFRLEHSVSCFLCPARF